MTVDEEAIEKAKTFNAPIKQHNRDFEATARSLEGWLAERLPDASSVEVLPIETPKGTGVANETLLFDARWREAGKETRGGFAARLATDNPLWMDADVGRQFKMYEALANIPGLPVPRAIGYEPDSGLLGTPFFVAERIAGRVPGDNPHYTEAGFVFNATPEQRRTMWEDAVRKLARLHQVETDRFDFLERPHLGESGLEQELRHWRNYFDWARGDREDDLIEFAFEWLVSNLPDPAPTSLSWGDARVGNMIFDDWQVKAILDWDQVSLAGPEADLAWWIQMDRFAWNILPGVGDPDDLIDLWEAETGRKAQDLHWHRVFTAFRLSTVMFKLHAQIFEAGLEGKATAELALKTGSIEQLAILLGKPLPGPSTTGIPELKRH
jgi:aminoglycoside phosphotransferase (APT) family kinase protein